MPSIAYSDDSSTVVHFERMTPEMTITEFNMTPIILNQGQTADFATTIQNTGLASGTANATVYIYNIGNSLVSTMVYDPATIGPGGTIILVKTWGSGTLPAGIYTAYVNATYGTNSTNTMNLSFIIRTAEVPGSGVGGGGGGGGGGGKPKPKPVPPSIIPVGEHVRFSQVPVLKEVLVGEGAMDSFTLINTAKENVTVELRMSGVPDEWVKLAQNVSVVFTNQPSNVNFVLSVPEDTLSGDYLMSLEAEGDGYYAKDYMLIRVKNYPKWHHYPIYLKTIRTDVLNERTDVSVKIENPSPNNMKSVELKETIPPSIVGGRPLSVNFNDKIGEISSVGGVSVVTWKVSDLGPLEQMTISYSIGGYLGDYHEYATWYLRQIDVGGKQDMESIVRVIDLSSQTISPGGSGDVTATILYAGSEPLEVTAMLELPPGFVADPGYASIMLIPRGLSNINFRVTAPKDVAQTHLIRAVVMGKDFNVHSSAPVLVRKGESSIIGSPIFFGGGGQGASQVASATISLPWLEIAGIVVVLALGFGLVAFAFGAMRTAFSGAGRVVEHSTYDFDRVKDLGNIRKVINQSIRGLSKK